jgi:hypothetical protein
MLRKHGIPKHTLIITECNATNDTGNQEESVLITINKILNLAKK